jgi:hypothetical protein
MKDEERQAIITKTKNSLTALIAKAHTLKVEADQLVADAQAKSMERLDVLEQAQQLAKEFEKLNNPKSLD